MSTFDPRPQLRWTALLATLANTLFLAVGTLVSPPEQIPLGYLGAVEWVLYGAGLLNVAALVWSIRHQAPAALGVVALVTAGFLATEFVALASYELSTL